MRWRLPAGVAMLLVAVVVVVVLLGSTGGAGHAEPRKSERAATRTGSRPPTLPQTPPRAPHPHHNTKTLRHHNPARTAAEPRDSTRAFGARAVEAFEIGNDHTVSANATAFHTESGEKIHARPPGYGYAQFSGEFGAIAAATPPGRLAGPALAVG